MRKEWFFNRVCGVQTVVYTEDGALVDVSVEDEEDGSLLGNIYKGKVQNVVAGMQAAFVSCGLEKNCYLPLNEGAGRFSSYDGDGKPHERVLKEGDEILVQVVKVPRGNKGAKVSCELSFVGKNLIFLPATDFMGISRKITDEAERERLLNEASALREEGQGFIVRTAAEEAEPRRLKIEWAYLKRIYQLMLEEAKNAPVGTAVYREYELPLKVMRDSLGGDIDKIYVGDRALYERMVRFVSLRTDIGTDKVEYYDGARDMYSAFGIAEQVYKLAEPEVPLKNGGYLVIDRTEAMTVIDVNTGKYVGDNNLEETVFETNVYAAREIARQVRLRNIGGIIAVDFIDMENLEHRAAVEEELKNALFSDRSKCTMLPMNELCVCLFTRKRTINPIFEFLLKSCPHCTREGYVLSDKYMGMRLRSELMEKFAEGCNTALVELNRTLFEKIVSEGYFREELAHIWQDKIIYMVPHTTWHEEKFTVESVEGMIVPENAVRFS